MSKDIIIPITLTDASSDSAKKQTKRILYTAKTVTFEIGAETSLDASYSIAKKDGSVITSNTMNLSGENKTKITVDVTGNRDSQLIASFIVENKTQVECTLDIDPAKLRVISSKYDKKEYEDKNCIDVLGGSNVVFNVTLSRGAQKKNGDKLIYKLYWKDVGRSEFKEHDCVSRDLNDRVTTSKINIFAPKNHSGNKVVVSFYSTDPVVLKEGTNQTTIRYFNIICEDGPGLRSVYWAENEAIATVIDKNKKIIDYKSGTVCTARSKNEDAFLHILTDQLFGRLVRVTLIEKDITGTTKLEIISQEVQLVDNVACVAFNMNEVYNLVKTKRTELLEGGDFDLIARVEVLDSHVQANKRIKETGVLDLKFKPSNNTPKKSTLNGTKKFVISLPVKNGSASCGGKHCITKNNYRIKNAGKLIQEINIRLAGFGGNVPTEEFTDRTENTIKQFQRDYMQITPTGKICGGLLKAIDDFCSKSEYNFAFNQTQCPCAVNSYKAPSGFKLCTGYGRKLTDENPGMHRSLLFILKALLFYLQKNKSIYSLYKIESGYRCVTNNKVKGRTSINHMGNALDLHFNKNGTRTRLESDMDTIRKNYFVNLMNAPYNDAEVIQVYHFGWKSNHIGLEPKKFNRGTSGATSWVHYDIREFESKYRTNNFYIKVESDLRPKSMIECAKELGFSDLCKCLNNQ